MGFRNPSVGGCLPHRALHEMDTCALHCKCPAKVVAHTPARHVLSMKGPSLHVGCISSGTGPSAVVHSL